jgi:type IX secretion system PorP/SprF family membrane protein
MKLLLSIVFFLGFYSALLAQDSVFSQYFLVPETLNPGFTGFYESTNVGVIHRSRISERDLKVNTDFAFINTFIESANTGVGLNFVNHNESFSNYNFAQLNVNYAYRVQLSNGWFFRPAIEIGLGNKSFGFANLNLEDQLDIDSGTIRPTSNESFSLNDKLFFLDTSAGLVFNNEDGWFGLSLKHLNKPNISLLVNGIAPLPMLFSANVGYKMKLADYLDIILFPGETAMLFNANYIKQGNYSRVDLGTAFIYDKFYMGINSSLNPYKQQLGESDFFKSVTLYGGIQYNHYQFGYSYEMSTMKINNGGGNHELYFKYQFDLYSKCYVCP